MKLFLHKLFEGFFIGVGIIIGMALITTLIHLSKVEELINPKPDINSLQILEHRTFDHGNLRYVVGSLKKIKDEVPMNITVKVDFFDIDEKFIEQCDSRIYQMINKTDVYNFKVQCYYDKETPPIKFHSYKVYLTTF